MTIENHRSKNRGFTLLELLLIIGIIAVLAGIVLMALNPAQRLNETNDAKAISNSNDIERAIKAYIVDKGGIIPASLSSITSTGIYDICKQGESTGCINLDTLITGYLNDIPVDTRYATANTTGYKIKYNSQTQDIEVYTQSDYEESIKYCPPGDTCPGPIGEWLFDDPSAGLVALDTSGNSNNGTLVNGPLWEDGKEGKAISFDGVDDYILTNNSFNFTRNESFTLQAWMKTSATSSSMSLVDKGYGYLNTYALSYDPTNGGAVFFLYSEAPSINVNSANTSTYSDNVWHLLTGVRDVQKDKIYMYVDGTLKGTTNDTSLGDFNKSSYVTIGARGNVPASYFNGQMDAVKIYNYARTPAQIAWEYNQGAPIAHWKFDETSGTTASDSSGNGNTGALNNGPVWTAGKYGNSIQFDGINDYISFTGWPSIKQANFSVTAWYKKNSGNPLRVGGQQYCGGLQFLLNLNTNNVNFYVPNAAGNCNEGIASSNITKLNEWNHVAGTFNGTNTILYLNGLKAAEDNTWSGTFRTNPNDPFVIGRYDCSAGCTYGSGMLDDVRIYNYVLTQSQVMQSMLGE